MLEPSRPRPPSTGRPEGSEGTDPNADARLWAPGFPPSDHDRRTVLAWGLAGVAAFSVTLPATRAAVEHLDPVFVGLGRAVVDSWVLLVEICR